MSIFRLSIILSTTMFLSLACDPDDPAPVNEEELITRLNYILTPNGGGEEVTLSFSDPDGDGPAPPIFTFGTLTSNTVYSGRLELFNDSVDPAENISEEIEEEDAEHQFFFLIEGIDVDVAYIDSDTNGNPVGLATTLTTGNASSGQLTIILRHEPDKSAAGVSEGDITNAGGETDIEVPFSVDIQ